MVEIILLRSRRRSSTIQEIGAVNPLTASRQSPLPASKAGQLFILTHNETLSGARRCASAMNIVRPPESTADMQPHVQAALLRLSAMISQYFTSGGLWFFCSLHSNDKISLAYEHAGDFKEW